MYFEHQNKGCESDTMEYFTRPNFAFIQVFWHICQTSVQKVIKFVTCNMCKMFSDRSVRKYHEQVIRVDKFLSSYGKSRPSKNSFDT